ncbi:putative ribonuclease T2 family protein [Rosellinia necatrix]|uniref:ribonuclease T2 n=1 Tax=Rosellinia necatrix TaxID=77044 RepID=A0A1S8A4T1_ROSNE|nr:putative ribonuclease T2 family protein [Rosellinia necatrix]
MKKYWTGLNQPSWVLWAHEFSKHATCFSTFDAECLGPSAAAPPHSEVADFFETVAAFYERVPTHAFLARAGVVPSNGTAYSLARLQRALRAGPGGRAGGRVPYLGCTGPRYNETEAGAGSRDDGFTVLAEVWYYYRVRGRVQRVDPVPVDPPAGGSLSNCATSPRAVWYYERTPGSVRLD